MTAVVIALCAAFTAGYLLRSHSAATERGRWDNERQRLRKRLRELWGWLEEAEALQLANAGADCLRGRLGADGWLYDALRAAHAEVRPGERAENLTIQTRWRDTGDTVLIGIDRGEQVAERAALLHVTDGETCWQQSEDIDIPPADSPQWRTG